MLELVEDQIMDSGHAAPAESIAYVVTGIDPRGQPARVLGLPFNIAVALFVEHAASLKLPADGFELDTNDGLTPIFCTIAADQRAKSLVSPTAQQWTTGSNSGFGRNH